MMIKERTLRLAIKIYNLKKHCSILVKFIITTQVDFTYCKHETVNDLGNILYCKYEIINLGHPYVYNAGMSCLVNDQPESQSIIIYCIRRNYYR